MVNTKKVDGERRKCDFSHGRLHDDYKRLDISSAKVDVQCQAMGEPYRVPKKNEEIFIPTVGLLLIAAKTDQNGMVNLLLGSWIFLKSRSENNENFEGQQPFLCSVIPYFWTHYLEDHPTHRNWSISLISTIPGSWAEKRLVLICSIWVCLKMAYIPPKKMPFTRGN